MEEFYFETARSTCRTLPKRESEKVLERCAVIRDLPDRLRFCRIAMLGRNMWRILLASRVLVFPCMASSFPDYPVRPVSDYPISTVKVGLTIAAHPLDSIKEQQTYFSGKLTPKGLSSGLHRNAECIY
jgi:hypothetical protein